MAGVSSASAPASPTSRGSESRVTHTFVIGAPTMALGYGHFLSGFKGLRFDFGGEWSTSLWLDAKRMPAVGLVDAALWRAAPANPSACLALPLDWRAARQVVGQAANKPMQATVEALAALEGSAVACWYGESTLYAPVFIVRLAAPLPQRDATLEALAGWAIKGGVALDAAAGKTKTTGKEKGKDKDGSALWRGINGAGGEAALGASGAYIAFSPDGALVEKVLDTIARRHPSVADQLPAGDATLALLTPRVLSAMAEREVMDALDGAGDANFLAAAQTHLPPRMKALAGYPAYRLELARQGREAGEWRQLDWRAMGAAK